MRGEVSNEEFERSEPQQSSKKKNSRFPLGALTRVLDLPTPLGETVPSAGSKSPNPSSTSLPTLSLISDFPPLSNTSKIEDTELDKMPTTLPLAKLLFQSPFTEKTPVAKVNSVTPSNKIMKSSAAKMTKPANISQPSSDFKPLPINLKSKKNYEKHSNSHQPIASPLPVNWDLESSPTSSKSEQESPNQQKSVNEIAKNSEPMKNHSSQTISPVNGFDKKKEYLKSRERASKDVTSNGRGKIRVSEPNTSTYSTYNYDHIKHTNARPEYGTLRFKRPELRTSLLSLPSRATVGPVKGQSEINRKSKWARMGSEDERSASSSEVPKSKKNQDSYNNVKSNNVLDMEPAKSKELATPLVAQLNPYIQTKKDSCMDTPNAKNEALKLKKKTKKLGFSALDSSVTDDKTHIKKTTLTSNSANAQPSDDPKFATDAVMEPVTSENRVNDSLVAHTNTSIQTKNDLLSNNDLLSSVTGSASKAVKLKKKKVKKQRGTTMNYVPEADSTHILHSSLTSNSSFAISSNDLKLDSDAVLEMDTAKQSENRNDSLVAQLNTSIQTKNDPHSDIPETTTNEAKQKKKQSKKQKSTTLIAENVVVGESTLNTTLPTTKPVDEAKITNASLDNKAEIDIELESTNKGKKKAKAKRPKNGSRSKQPPLSAQKKEKDDREKQKAGCPSTHKAKKPTCNAPRLDYMPPVSSCFNNHSFFLFSTYFTSLLSYLQHSLSFVQQTVTALQNWGLAPPPEMTVPCFFPSINRVLATGYGRPYSL